MTEYFCKNCGEVFDVKGMAWTCPNCLESCEKIITYDAFQRFMKEN